jgi:hypothetical protein
VPLEPIKTRRAEFMRINNNGVVSIGNKLSVGGPTTATSPDAAFTVQNSGADIGKVTAVFGADTNTNTLTDNTVKEARIGIPHYDTAEEPVALIYSTSGASTNNLTIGGGTSRMNAATNIYFRTASNSTTTSGSTAININSVQRVSIGAYSAQSYGGSYYTFNVTGTSLSNSTLGAVRYASSSFGPYLTFGKSRGVVVGANTIVQENDYLGVIRAAGADGGDLAPLAASIDFRVDGSPGVNDMPGRIVFGTTADGAQSPTERMKIDDAGRVIINSPDVSTGKGTNKALLQVANIDTTSDWGDINTGANAYASTANEIAVLNTANQDLNGFAGIFFQAGEASNGSTINSARIGAIKTATAGTSTDLAFATRNSSANMVEHMRISSEGYVGIGTDSPVGALTVIQNGSDNDHGIRLQCNDDGSSTAPDIQLYKNSASPADNDNIGAIWFNANDSGGSELTYAAIYGVTRDVSNGSEDGSISFGTTNNGSFSVKSQIHQNGVYINPEGICLGTSTYETYAAANTLDDYEEGTWTPTMEFSTTNGTISYTVRSGSYTKIGRIVYINAVITTSSITGNSGDLLISGLPFTVGGYLPSTSNEGYALFQYKLGSAGAGKYVGYFDESTSKIVSISRNSDLGDPLNDANMPSSTSLRLAGWYQV